MSRGELGAGPGPASAFGLDAASRHRSSLDAARAIVATSATSRPPAPAVRHTGGAGKRLPPARPVQSPLPGRAGRSSSRIDAEVVIGIAIGLGLAVLIAGLSFLARNAGHGGIWL